MGDSRAVGFLLPVVLVVCCGSIGGGVPAAAPEVEAALTALHGYLADYEPKLSELIAEERFEQSLRRPGRAVTRRVLVSDVAFMRLPGDLEWLGTRSVRLVDGLKPRDDLPTLESLLTVEGEQRRAQARRIAEGNARHNLGHARSLNLPTLPLDLLDRRNATAFEVVAGPLTRQRGVEIQELNFEERLPARVVSDGNSRFVRSLIRAWVALPSGALQRAEVDLVAPVPMRVSRHRIAVAFGPDESLGMLVPRELAESAPGLSGRALYERYRRFRTSARIVP